MNYKKLNNYTGWIILLIATAVYVLTLEPTTSLWDCGEYITTAYKLEVGHPPGAPLFMMLGRLFTVFASQESAAYMVNLMSALSSSFTILFLFWSITMIAKKIILTNDGKLIEENNTDDIVDKLNNKATFFSNGQKIAVIGSGVIGALAYTFTDSFWFSAVEGEVYAMSSFFTAIVMWAILKWETEITEQENNPENKELQLQNPNRWIIFIFFMVGLSIGVHLLNLLCIPAIAYIIYFKKFKFDIGGFLLTGVIGVGTLGLIQAIIIPKTIELAGGIEKFFVNSLGLPFNSGAVFFTIIIVALLATLLIFSKKTKKYLLNTITWSFTMILIGYTCFAMIVIRSNANTPLDENDPENLVSLEAYLKREQYGDWPILYGQYYNAPFNKNTNEQKDRSDVFLKRYVVQSKKGTKDIAGFINEEDAQAYIEKSKMSGLTIKQKYYKTFDGTGKKQTYEKRGMTFFPRMYSADSRHVSGYRNWSGHSDAPTKTNETYYNAAYKDYISKRGRKDDEKAKLLDKRVFNDEGKLIGFIPTFGENLSYFANYQVGWMYWRYFMWNFAGRQSDEQGHGGPRDGNWISGLNFIDQHHIGDQTKIPSIIAQNPSHNVFYLLPLILGLIGFIYTLINGTKSWWLITLLFLLTGFAVIIYLSQKPFEPRERDYAYAASFYAFSFWIGLSVLALYEAYKKMKIKDLAIIGGGLLIFSVIISIGGATGGLSMLYISAVIIAAFGLMLLLRAVIKNESQTAIAVTLLCLPVPILMGMQGWDDHDRSNRYTAQALAENYLNSCSDNSIIYTNGDNDTFPLWYLQEVEGKKTSVRVCNLSLLNTDWYTGQMRNAVYDSEPLPITFEEHEYRQNGYLDAVVLSSTNNITMGAVNLTQAGEKIVEEKIKLNPKLYKKGFNKATNDLFTLLSRTPLMQTNPDLVNNLKTYAQTGTYKGFRRFCIDLLQKGSALKLTEQNLGGIQKILMDFNDSFDYWPIQKAMAYIHDENNLTENPNTKQKLFYIPANHFTLAIDKEKIMAQATDADSTNDVVGVEDFDRIVDKIVWKSSKNVLYKADIMILEMIANFNWDRNIYFASSAAKDTYLGLENYFYAEGLVYKFVPIKITKNRNPNSYGEINKTVMYNNLMKKFHWGNMEKEGVLVDYYTRRNVNNYRVQFSVLADAFVEDFELQSQKLEFLNSILAQSGDGLPSDTIKTPMGEFIRGQIPSEIEKTEKAMKDSQTKASEVILRAFEIMPANKIPYGRIAPYFITGLYSVGNIEQGKKYALDVLNAYDEELEYYTSVDSEFSVQMLQDMFGVYRSTYTIYQKTMLEGADPEVGKIAENIMDKHRIKIERIKIPKESKDNYKSTFGGFFKQIDQIKKQTQQFNMQQP